MNEDEKRSSSDEQSYVLVARDYADIAHLENPSVIERILSTSRKEKVEYVSALITSGVSKFVIAGPKVAFAAMTAEALTDFGREVSGWIRSERIPGNFSGRPSGYQTWVELLQEIDSNPADSERLKAMKAMFLAANSINASDGQSILAYQLFQIAKRLNAGELLLLKAVHSSYKDYGHGPRRGGVQSTQEWRQAMAHRLGHQLISLVGNDERKLVELGLIAAWTRTDELQVPLMDARMTDLGIRFCKHLEEYEAVA